MHTTGSCFCGAIEWKADIDPNMIAACHCRDCQIFSSSAFRLAGGAPSSFAFTKGEPRFFDKTADSGNIRRMAFCGECGTHLASLPPDSDEASQVSIRLATSVDFAELRPIAEIFCDSKMSWMPAIENTVAFPREPKIPDS